MNRKRVRRISLIVVLFLALAHFGPPLQGGPKSREHAAALFQKNRSAFDSAAAQAVEQGSGQGIPRPFGVRDVTLWDYGGTAVDFSWKLWDRVSHNILGIQYVPSGERLGFQGSRLRAGFPTGTAGAGGERRGQPLLHPGAGRVLVLL